MIGKMACLAIAKNRSMGNQGTAFGRIGLPILSGYESESG